MSLDDVLLRAKLRRLDDSSGWLVKKAQQKFRQHWRTNRPALETGEAFRRSWWNHFPCSRLVRVFIVEFGGAFEQILKMEIDAASVLMRAFEWLVRRYVSAFQSAVCRHSAALWVSSVRVFL